MITSESLAENKSQAYAIIFNNEIFDQHLRQPERNNHGKKDANLLKETFEKYNIAVDIKQDYTLVELKKEVERLSVFDFSPVECFIVVILTQSEENISLYVKDDKYNLYEDFVIPIVEKNKTLNMKPKLFIIQSDKGKNPQQYASSSLQSSIIPSYLEFFFCFGSYEGYTTNYGEDGGIYIKNVCYFLQKHGCTWTLPKIMEHVNDKMSTIQPPQIPMVISTMTRSLIIGKLAEEDST